MIKTMKKLSISFLFIGVLFLLNGCAHLNSIFKPKPVTYDVVKVNSDKKYLQLMSRTRGVLGTSNWGKFNYDVVELPYELQGEYFARRYQEKDETAARGRDPARLDLDRRAKQDEPV